jgi:guanylate kinase
MPEPRDGGEQSARLLMVLSGPSGVGKGTVVEKVRQLYPHVWVSVSYTTRAPRRGEVDGVQYRFIDRPAFARLIEAGEMLEYDEHFGNIYGTLREPVLAHLAAGDPTLLEIDLHGARQVRTAMPQAHLVFLRPPSWDELARRLGARGSEPQRLVEERLDRARLELAAEAEFDSVIVNDDVERAAGELVDLLESACRPNGR